MRILYITTKSPPYPPTNGGRQRSNLLFHALAEVAEVDLVVIGGGVEPDDEREMQESFGLIGIIQPALRSDCYPWRIFRSLNPTLVNRLAHNLGRRIIDYRPDSKVQQWFDDNVDLERYDLIVGRYLHSITKPGLLSRPNIVLDVDDHDTEVYRSRLSKPNLAYWERLAIQHHIRQLDQIIPNQLKRIKKLWVANVHDQNLPGLNTALLLPNIPFFFSSLTIEPFPDITASKRILMVGSWSHRPNTRGRDYFVQHIWPEIRSRIPDAEFDIVGGGMSTQECESLSKIPGVNPIGFVDSVFEYYQRCAFSVAPIFEGGGTNIKVIESLALGRTCVVSQKAHMGYERTLVNGEALLVSKDTDSFSRNCIKLLTSPEMRSNLSNRGNLSVRRHYSFERFCDVVKNTIADINNDRD